MTEDDYIFVQNLTWIRATENALRNVTPGREYYVNTKLYTQAIDALAEIRQKLFEELELTYIDEYPDILGPK